MSAGPSSSNTSEDENSRSPEESTRLGHWECEPVYYSLPGRNDKSRRGKAYRKRQGGDLKCFEAHDGVIYRPGDHVYVETNSQEPYLIGSIQQFKMTKRDQLSVKVTRFYRPMDVPDVSLSLITQERREMECDQHRLEVAHSREIFSSEAATHHSIGALRGKCEISFVRDIRSLGDCDPTKENVFVCCLSFNQESSRLAAVQGEIRVGNAFQAKLPGEPSCSVAEDEDKDELLYRPGQVDRHSESNYVKLTRTFRTFSLINSKMTETERNARVGDRCMDDAIMTLHRCGYNQPRAIKEMAENDKLLAKDDDVNYMTSEDTKKFGKGIKTYGKNFVRISKEMLPHHSRDQLVGFYYLWKKTADATKPKIMGRPRNAAAIKRNGKSGQPKASRPGSSDLHDYSSATESDLESQEPEAPKRACHHCYETQSRDWHHAGRESLLLCTDCRLYYKRYGQLRPVDRPSTVPPCLYKRSTSNDDEEESGVRTRAGKKERRRTPSMGDERRSPSQAQSVHEFDLEKRPIHRNGKRKRSHLPPVNGTASAKKRSKEEEKDSEPDGEKETDKVEMVKTEATSPPPPLENGVSDEHIIAKEEKEEEKREEPATVKLEKMEEDQNDEKCSLSIISSLSTPSSSAPSSTSSSTLSTPATNAPSFGVSPAIHVAQVQQPAPVPSPSMAAEAPKQDATTCSGVVQQQQEAAAAKMEIEPSSASEERCSATTTTESCMSTSAMSTASDDSDRAPYVEDDYEMYDATGDEIKYTSVNSLFIIVTKWKDGQRSARTDLRFKNKPGSVWDKRRAELREKALRAQAPAEPIPVTQPKKELNGTPSLQDVMNGRVLTQIPGLPAGFPGINQQMLMQMLQQQQMQQMMQEQAQAQAQAQQQAQAQAQAAAQQQAAQQQAAQQQAQQQQQQQMMKMQIDLMRALAARGGGGPMGGAAFPGHAGGMPVGVPFSTDGMLAPDAMQRFQMDLIMQQHMAQAQAQAQHQAAAAAGMHPGMNLPPEVQMMLSQMNPRNMEAQVQAAQAAQAQQAAAAQQQAAAMAAVGMHPMLGGLGAMGAAGMLGTSSASDMMRRLQHEGFRPPQ